MGPLMHPNEGAEEKTDATEAQPTNLRPALWTYAAALVVFASLIAVMPLRFGGGFTFIVVPAGIGALSLHWKSRRPTAANLVSFSFRAAAVALVIIPLVYAALYFSEISGFVARLPGFRGFNQIDPAEALLVFVVGLMVCAFFFLQVGVVNLATARTVALIFRVLRARRSRQT